LPPKHEKCREILREFDLTAVQGHPRSSILVSMESTLCDFLLVIGGTAAAAPPPSDLATLPSVGAVP